MNSNGQAMYYRMACVTFTRIDNGFNFLYDYQKDSVQNYYHEIENKIIRVFLIFLSSYKIKVVISHNE